VRSRSLAIGATLALVSLAVALAVARSGGSPVVAARPAPRETPVAAIASPAPVAPETLRDIFRFVDEREAPSRVVPTLVEDDAAPPVPAPPGPRLVGLIWRSGRLVAALALDGEVALAGPGESAASVTVVSVADDSVRIRRGDGSESTLVLP
jgi:hypothetical protein